MENGRMTRRMEKVNHIINTIGIFYFANDDIYNGEWKDDKKNGKGKSHLYS